jgi:nicotinamide-nucleotide amidase
MSMISDPEFYQLAVRAGERLLAAGRRLATAESCTAGWVAKVITDVPGSSNWFECGYVTYSDRAKQRDLGVGEQTLKAFGAVSEQTAREMAAGVLRLPQVSVAIAVTGIAGPDGGTPEKPVGTVWFCAAARGAHDLETLIERKCFSGDRNAVRSAAVRHALELVLRLP